MQIGGVLRYFFEKWVVVGGFFKNLLMALFLMGCFPGDFQEANGPLRHSGKRAH